MIFVYQFDVGSRLIGAVVESFALLGHLDQEPRLSTPNDPKLSDCGARRAGCGKAAGAGWAQAAGWSAAASVTRGAVRCSAWLGVAGLC